MWSVQAVITTSPPREVIVTGAWKNMSIEHTARSGADKGYFMFVSEDYYALQNVSTVTNCDAIVAAIAG